MTDIEDPFADSAITDADIDPFADPEEVEGPKGPFIPWPKVDVIRGRLVALAPISFDEEAKTSEYAQKTFNSPPTHQEWRADLVVLDGGAPFSYQYTSKVEGSTDEFEEKTFTVAELPFFVPNFRVTWANVIGTLNRGAEKGILIGRFEAGYSAKEMRAGKTFEDFQKEEEAFFKAPRGKVQPKAKWHFVLSRSPEDKALAMDWYRVAHAEGYRVPKVEYRNVPDPK